MCSGGGGEGMGEDRIMRREIKNCGMVGSIMLRRLGGLGEGADGEREERGVRESVHSRYASVLDF